MIIKEYTETDNALFIGNKVIPKVEENSDYQEFLKQVEKGEATVTPQIIPQPTPEEKRVGEYPSAVVQLEMLHQDMIDGTNKWKDAITAIKAKYPIAK